MTAIDAPATGGQGTFTGYVTGPDGQPDPIHQAAQRYQLICDQPGCAAEWVGPVDEPCPGCAARGHNRRYWDDKRLAQELYAHTLAVSGPWPGEDDYDDPDRRAGNHNLINWDDFWVDDTTNEDWFAYPLLPAHRGVALYAPAKTGKSLVMLYIAAALATGRPCLGQPARQPQHILYLDYEMTKADVRERLEDMGYGPEVDMSHFHYDLMPATAPLDTKAGGDDVVALAVALDVQAVIVDTFSRVISREENDNKAAQEFYSHVGRPLKAAGIGVYRLDHAGKDLERGQRGGSAKNDDVDVVWQLLAGEDGCLKLKRTYSRVGWIPETVELVRTDDPLGFVYEEKAAHYQPGTKEAAAVLDRLRLPVDVGRRKAREALKAAHETMGTALLADAIRWRKASLPAFGGPLANVSTDLVDTSKADYLDTSGGHVWTTPSEQGGHVDGHVWTHELATTAVVSIPKDGHTAEGPPPTTPEPPEDDEELSLL